MWCTLFVKLSYSLIKNTILFFNYSKKPFIVKIKITTFFSVKVKSVDENIKLYQKNKLYAKHIYYLLQLLLSKEIFKN